MLARNLGESTRPLAPPDRQLVLGTTFDSWLTRRTAIDQRDENNQSALLSPHSNAKFTGKRHLSMRDDARSNAILPGAHMAAVPRLSGATTR
jgi:hypothetical protein